MNIKKVDDSKNDEESRVLKIMATMQSNAEKGITSNTSNTSQNVFTKIDNNVNYFQISDIPTKFRLYPENTIIEARPLKVLEIKKLASITTDNADYIINDILRKCVKINNNLIVDDLYSADKMYLIFWLRGVTYRDSSYTVDFVCSKCKTNSKYNFQIKNLSINYLKDDYNPNNELILENDDIINLRFLKIKDEFEIERFIDINKKLLGDIDIELLALSCMITTINGKSYSLIDKYNYVINITARDLSLISTFIDNYNVGIDSTMQVECANCGGVVPLGITFQSDFFLPKYTTI